MRKYVIALGVVVVLLVGVRPAIAQHVGVEPPEESTSTTTSAPTSTTTSQQASKTSSSPESESAAASSSARKPAKTSEPADANEEAKAEEEDCENKPDTMVDDCKEIEDKESDSGGGGFVGKMAGSALARIAAASMRAATEIIKMIFTWWMQIPSPALREAPGLYEKINGYTRDIQLVLLTASLMVVALRIAMARRGMIEGTVYETTGSFIKIIISSAMWGPLIMMLMHAGDVFSNYILSLGAMQAADELFGVVAAMSVIQNPFLPLIVSVFVILTGLIQVVFLFVRAALLLVVAAVIPLAAAAGGTAMGRETYERLQSWTIALLLFKPVGALVYFVALEAIDTSKTLGGFVVSFLLLSMAVLTLPALLKLVAPATEGMGTGPSAASVIGSAAGMGASAMQGTGVPGAAMKLAGSIGGGAAGKAGAAGGGGGGGAAAGPAEFSRSGPSSGGAGSPGGGGDSAGGAGLTSGAQEGGAAAAGGAGGAAAGAATGGVATAVGAAAGAINAAADTVNSTANEATNNATSGGSGGGSAGGPADMSSSPAPGTAPIDQLSSSQSEGNGFVR